MYFCIMKAFAIENAYMFKAKHLVNFIFINYFTNVVGYTKKCKYEEKTLRLSA